MNRIIEVCVTSVESAMAAEKGGATRVELCDNIFEGGTTPSPATISIARKYLKIKLNVLIRPRGGDFCYSDIEYEVMKQDIEFCKQAGSDGVVIGILNPDGSIDVKRTSELVQLARPMSVTFHRAFDMVAYPFKALEEICAMQIDRILTSGLEKSAFEGAELIKELIEKAAGRVIIMPGGGVSERNISKIEKITGATEFHVSGRKKVASRMQFQNHSLNMGGGLFLPEFETSETNEQRINKFVS